MSELSDLSRKLKIVTQQEGWKDVLDIWESEVDKAEFRLLNVPSGSTEQLVRDLLAQAKSYRSIFEQMQLRIQHIIHEGEDELQQLSEPPSWDSFNL